jgi:flagellar capping protein FliD
VDGRRRRHESTNTFANILEGVTLTVTKADTQVAGSDPSSPAFVEAPVTVDVKKDTDGIAAKISALVDAANAARSEAKSLTAMDPTTKARAGCTATAASGRWSTGCGQPSSTAMRRSGSPA